MRVAICICTFRRPELLSGLLNGIAGLRFHRVQEPQIQIVVVDNDEQASSREICGGARLPWPIHYVVEPVRGITPARNRAITEAGEVDFIAFIDDDEVPTARWLDELLATQCEFAVDVVSGPVLPKYAPEVPEWVKNGRFFEPPIFVTGSSRNTCASNNVLMAIHILERVPGFDAAFALSGAEDTNFFLQVRKAGHKIAWSQAAAVFELVPAHRGTILWMLRREFQTGNGWVFCETAVDGRFRRRASRFLRACGHVALGSVAALWQLIRLNKSAFVRSLQRVSKGMGMLAGLAGHRFLAYETQNLQQLAIDKPAAQAPSWNGPL